MAAASQKKSGVPLPWYDQPNVPSTIRELIFVRDVGVSAVSRSNASYIPWIASKAEKFFPHEHSVSRSLERLLVLAIGQITDPAVQEAAVWEFGLEESAFKGVTARRMHICQKIFHVSERQYRRGLEYERRVVGLTADALSDLRPELKYDNPRIPKVPYVERPELTSAISELVMTSVSDWTWERRNVLFLIGEPGTGKTRLVRQHFQGTKALFLNCTTREALLLSISKFIDGQRTEPGLTSAPTLETGFARILGRRDAPKTIILDGYADFGRLEDLLPKDTTSFVIVTGRKPPPDGYAPSNLRRRSPI